MTTPNHRAMHADDFFPVREGALCVEGVPCEALARDCLGALVEWLETSGD